MRHPRILAFGPRRPWARPGAHVDVVVEIQPGSHAADVAVALLDEDRVIALRRRRLPAMSSSSSGAGPAHLACRFRLPEHPRHGYGLQLSLRDAGWATHASSAVEGIEDWWQSPRHAALTDFRDPDIAAAAARDLATWHVTVAQHYDWMWRHYRYRPPHGQEPFADALGRVVSHAAVRAAIRAGHRAGVASLAYGSVYGAEPEYVRRHPDERVFDEQGRPLSLGDLFFINDLRPGSPWRRRLLGEYRAAVRAFGFDGIHMDTYGRPHSGAAADGGAVDFAALYPGLIEEAAHAVGRARRGARVLFNCVDGFPLEAVAPAPGTALYLELWPPYRAFADVVRWIERARAVAAGRAIVIAAYAAPLRGAPRGQERVAAFEATLLLGSVIWAAGACHHTLAAADRLLVEGYYPAAIAMRAHERRALRAQWVFSARYLHLLGDPDLVPADTAGLTVVDGDGLPVSTSTTPLAGAVWATARTTPDGRRVLHLVDLRDQPDDHWDAPKVPARLARGLVVEWPGLRDPHAATPWDRRGAAIRLRSLGSSGTPRRWRLPTFRRWLLVAERGARTAHHLDD